MRMLVIESGIESGIENRVENGMEIGMKRGILPGVALSKGLSYYLRGCRCINPLQEYTKKKKKRKAVDIFVMLGQGLADA